MKALAWKPEITILPPGPAGDAPVGYPLGGAMLVHVVNPMIPQLGARRFSHCEGLTVLEAVERAGWELPWSTQLVRSGIRIRRDDWDAVPIGAGELVLLVTYPQGGKGGASQIFAIVASIALALFAPEIAGFLLGQDLAGTVAFAGITFGQIATVGIVLAGSTLISALLPHPKPITPAGSNALGNSGGPQSPTYSLSAQSNTARLLAPIPERFGYFRFAPDLSTSPYFDFVHSEQELLEEFALGMGEYEIHEVGIANNAIWADGDYTGTYPEIELLFMPPGTPNTLFSTNVVTSPDVSNIALIGTNEDGYDWSGPIVLNPADSECFRAQFDIALPGGLFALDTTGNLKAATVSFEVQVQEIDDSGTAVGGWTSLVSDSLTMTTRDPIRKTYSATLGGARYHVRFERTNAKATDINTFDQLAVLAMRAFLPDAPVRADVTGIAMRAHSTKNLNGDNAQSFYVIATRKLPIWNAEDGTWSDPTATRTISAAAAYACRATNGLRRNDNQVDLAKLAVLEAIWTDRGDTFDGAFDTGDSAWTNLQSILRVGRAEPLRLGRYITFNRDEPKSVPVAAFSPANMLSGSFNIDYIMFDDNSTDGIWIDYIDQRNWKPNSVWCALPDSTVDPDDAPHTSILGVIDYDQAWREGMFMVACNRWRRRFPNFRTEMEGRVCFRGSKIAISHWLLSGSGVSGQVLDLTQDDAGDEVLLSEPWDEGAVLDDGTKVITITTPDGQPYGPVTIDLVDAGEDSGKAIVRMTSTAVVASGKYAGQQPRDWAVWEGAGLEYERPRAVWGTAANKQLDGLLIAMKPEAGLTVQIAAVIDDQRVHYADGTIPPIEGDTPASPDEDNPPTPASADDLTITAILAEEINQGGGVTSPSVLAFTVQGAPAAASFQARYKWNDATTYGGIIEDLKRVFTIPAVTGNVSLQARARGLSGFGPWKTVTTSAVGRPPAPTLPDGSSGALAITTTGDWNWLASVGPTWNWTADPDPNAVQYVFTYYGTGSGQELVIDIGVSDATIYTGTWDPEEDWIGEGPSLATTIRFTVTPIYADGTYGTPVSTGQISSL